MGTIYKVRHNLLDEIRVLKFMKPAVTGDADLDQRFLQEARLVTRFNHRNIAAVYDFSIDAEKTAYIVMEYVEGVNLVELVKSTRQVGLHLLLEIAKQTLDALGYLHGKKVIHRDVSPDNIMVTVEDRRPVVKIIDLGIAKSLDTADDLTKTGFFLGKLKYASPEQLGSLPPGERIDHRSDLYSFAVVLYELATGQLPFRTDNPRSLLAAHLFEAPRAFDETDPSGRVPEGLRVLIRRGLEKDRQNRFDGAGSFRDALVAVQQQLPGTTSDEEVLQLHDAIVAHYPDEQSMTPTPSVQRRMDDQFALSARTPAPTSSTLEVTRLEAGATLSDTTQVSSADQRATQLAGEMPTVAAPAPDLRGARGYTSAETTVVQAAKSGKRRMVALGAGLALLITAIVAGVFIVDGAGDRVRSTTAQQEGTDAAAAPATLTAPPMRAAEPMPITEPSTGSSDVAAESDDAQSAQVERLVREMESARAIALRDRDRALSAGARRHAPLQSRRAASALAEGERLAAAGEHERASAAYADASALSAAAYLETRRATQPPPMPPPSAKTPAVTRSVTRSPEPAAKQAPPERTAPPAVATQPLTSAQSPAPERKEPEQLIRETMQAYIAAQEALDVDRYAAVYPDVDRARVQRAFRSFRSQSLDLSLERVSVDGDRAVVTATEQRRATPRVGTEQRVESRRTFTLERRGDRWIIVSIR